MWAKFNKLIVFISSLMLFFTLIFQGGMIYNKLGELEKKIDFLYDKFFDYINNKEAQNKIIFEETSHVKKM